MALAKLGLGLEELGDGGFGGIWGGVDGRTAAE